MSPTAAIVWDQNVPPELRLALEPLVRDWAAVILPAYLHQLKIQWDPADTKNEARAYTQGEYRQGAICFCPSFLSLSPPERDRTALHELSHLLVDPIATAADTLLELVKEKHPDAHKLALEMKRQAMEATVTDVTHALRAARAAAPVA